MRGPRFKLVCATIVIAIAVSCSPGSEPGPQSAEPTIEMLQQQPTTTPLKVWTANVKYLQMRWKRLINKMGRHERDPELVFMQEVEARHVDRFREALAAKFGGSYAMRWVDGDNAVVWRTGRLDLANTNTSTNVARNSLRWKSWGKDGCDGRDRGQIALRLWDRSEDRVVVAASIRWTHTTAFECMQRNLSVLDRKIEDKWPVREITLVAGDFNSVADRRTTQGGSDLIEAGRETDPECWYRVFSAVDANALENDRSGESDLDCSNNTYFRNAADRYYDSVGITKKRVDADAICKAWTHVRKDRARRGTSCTDTNKDGLRDRARLDYIWVRWEDASGDVEMLTRAEAAARFGRAGADSSCIDEDCLETRYSDHRAAFATVY